MLIQRQRYLPWVMLFAPAMSAGAFMLSFLSFIPEQKWLILPLLMVVFSVWLLKRWRVVAWLIMGLAIGIFAMYLKMLMWQSQQIPELWFNQPFQAQIMVEGIAKPVSGGWQCEANILSAPSNILIHQSIQLYWSGDRRPLAGEVWSARLSLQPVTGWSNPGGFDYAGYMFTKGIQAQAKVLSRSDNPDSIQSHWQAWRWQMLSQMMRALPDSPFMGLNLALLMGEGLLISQEQWQVLRDTGTLHLAVVSGMHLTLVGGFAGLLAMGLWRLFPSERFSMVLFSASVAWIVAVIFAILAGLNLPVQRALIMISVVLIAVILKRDLHPLLSLSWALLLVILWDISSVMQAGFWLSFLATGALVWLIQSPQHWVWKVVGLHLGMSLLLAPFLMIFFQQMPVYAPLANLIAAPVIEWFLIPLLLLSGLLSFVSADATMQLGLLADRVWQPLWDILVAMSQWQYSVMLVNVSGWHWGLLSVWLIAVILSRKYLMSFVGMLLLAIPTLALPLLPVADHANGTKDHHIITLLETGKTDMVVIWQSDRGNWLLGTGQAFGQQHTMDMVVLPALTKLGIHHLDGVWLWQDTQDAQTGLAKLQKRLPVTEVKTNIACLAEKSWQWQKNDEDCWLGLPMVNQQWWLSYTKPKSLPKGIREQDMVISNDSREIQEGHAIKSLPVRLWLTNGQSIRSKLAKERHTTSDAGAITVQIKSTKLTVSEYRQTEKRFFMIKEQFSQ